MTTKAPFILALLGALVLGLLLGPLLWSPDPEEASGTTDSAPETSRDILYWVAPMDPNYRRDQPGKSPMGMDLVPVYADGQPAAGTVRVDPAVVANLGVRTAPAERGRLPRRIDTVGYVGYDEETIQHVHTRVDGWVESLSVTATGDPVTRGQVLFELYAPALVNAQQEYLAAVASGNEALVRASRERLSALGMDAASVDRLQRERRVTQRVAYRAASDGVIAFLGVREGIFVTPATEVLSVARLDPIWVTAEVLERQADWVAAGQDAEVRLDPMPGAVLDAEVDYVYPELDPVSRTLRVRLRLDNPRGLLRPNMFARVRIEGSETPPVVHVPRQALIRAGDGQRLVVRRDDGRFSVREVVAGIESGDRVAIRRGLEADETVVVSGQFLIDSEANAGSALRRLDASREEDGRMDHSGHDMDGMDHSGHGMEDMDHSGHGMDGMDHSGHDREDMDHSGHSMEDMDHSGHGMDDMDHSGHGMDGMDHSGHDGDETDHSNPEPPGMKSSGADGETAGLEEPRARLAGRDGRAAAVGTTRPITHPRIPRGEQPS